MYPKKEKKNHNHESKRSIRPSIQANFNNKLLSSTFSQHPVRVKATPHNVLQTRRRHDYTIHKRMHDKHNRITLHGTRS